MDPNLVVAAAGHGTRLGMQPCKGRNALWERADKRHMLQAAPLHAKGREGIRTRTSWAGRGRAGEQVAAVADKAGLGGCGRGRGSGGGGKACAHPQEHISTGVAVAEGRMDAVTPS